MENRGRDLSRDESDRGSMSSRSDSTPSPERGTRRPARDANLRSLGMNRSAWNQETQVMNNTLLDRQRGNTANYASDMSIDQQQDIDLNRINDLDDHFRPQETQRMIMATDTLLHMPNGQIINITDFNGSSMLNRGDNSSRSDRTNSPTDHSARRAGLRFTGIDPDTWGQDAQNREVINSGRESLFHQTQYLPLDQQRPRHQAWINSPTCSPSTPK